MLMTAPFPSSKRLDQSGVKAVLQKGRCKRGRYFDLRQIPTTTHDGSRSGARLAISVPKRVLRLAVQRNKVKRLVREAFRTNRISCLPLDLLVVYRSKVSALSAGAKNALREELDTLFLDTVARNSSKQPNLDRK